jgi:hypothetical protein
MLSMLDLRRTAAPLRAARLAALAAVLTMLCLLAAASAAHAESGELAAWGPVGVGAGNYRYIGPVAVDPGTASTAAADKNEVYLADRNDTDHLPRITKFSPSGTALASIVIPDDSNPSGSLPRIVGMAVDPNRQRLYVLMGTPGYPDTNVDNSSVTVSEKLLVLSTQQVGNRLVAPGGAAAPATLTDFGTAGGWVDYPSALAVDPGTSDIAFIGTDDDSADDPTGVIQYVRSDGTLDTRTTGLGAADPDPADRRAIGMAIGPDGKVFVPAVQNATDVTIYSLPRGSSTATAVVTDPASNGPQNQSPVFGGQSNGGAPIAVSLDGRTVWLAESNGPTARARGFSVATGEQELVYGGGTTSCNIPNQWNLLGLATGSDDRVVTASGNFSEDSYPDDKTVHVFGPGGTGCPIPEGRFTINGREGNATVVKGQSVSFDASGSNLQGGDAGEVDWDFDGSGAYGSVFNDAGGLRTTYTFTRLGRVDVGLKIHVQGGAVTQPVTYSVTVVAPRPTAAFTMSTNRPAAGGTVTFDATNSIDPGQAGADAHRLKTYRWDFGDGSAPVDTTTPTTSHAFANPGSSTLNRTVRLVVVSSDDVSSDPFSQAVAVGGTPTQQPPATTTDRTPPPTTTTTPRPGPNPPTTITFPAAGVSGSSVDARGTTALKVTCPAGGNPCTGTITLTTKVTKKVRGRKKVTTVKLGTVTFSVDAGRSKSVRVRLSSAGRSLLKRSKRLAVSAAITLKVSGQSKTTSKSLTLKAASAKKH